MGTPIALATQGGFIPLMFGFENENLLTVALDESAIEQKRIPLRQSE